MLASVFGRTECGVAPALTGVLRSMTTILRSVGAETSIEAVSEQLERHAQILQRGVDCRTASTIARDIATNCDVAAAAVKRREECRQQDIAAFLAAVRETLSSLVAIDEAARTAVADMRTGIDAEHRRTIEGIFADHEQERRRISRH